jgi:hypothetical protein
MATKVIRYSNCLVLYEIVRVPELQFTADKIHHVNKVGRISVPSGSFFANWILAFMLSSIPFEDCLKIIRRQR